MAKSVPAGSVHIDVNADTSGYQDGLKKAKRDTENFADSARRSFTRVERFQAGLAKATGVIAGFAAVITTTIKVMEKLNELFGDGQKKAEQFVLTLNTADNAAALSSVRNEIAQLEAQLDASLSGGAFAAFFRGEGISRPVEQLKEQIEELRRTEKSLNDQRNAQILQGRRDEAAEQKRLAEEVLQEEMSARMELEKTLHDQRMRFAHEEIEREYNERRQAAEDLANYQIELNRRIADAGSTTTGGLGSDPNVVNALREIAANTSRRTR